MSLIGATMMVTLVNLETNALAAPSLPSSDRSVLQEGGQPGWFQCATPALLEPGPGEPGSAVPWWRLETSGRVTGLEPESVITVPVAFHVITAGETGYVDEATIDAQIDVLNTIYAPYGFAFALDSVDVTDNRLWYHMRGGTRLEATVKAALVIDPYTHLNIYTADADRYYTSWATFPWDLETDPDLDGVVLDPAVLPGGSGTDYNTGDIAVHEVGHWLGLFHTYQNGCNDAGDSVDDTPAEAQPTGGCPEGQDTCASSGVDPIHNYMDGTTDACKTEFTPGQNERMLSMVEVYRYQLL